MKLATKREKLEKKSPQAYAPAGHLYSEILVKFSILGANNSILAQIGVKFGMEESTFR